MSDVFETTVVVEVAPEEVWKALTERTLEAAEGGSEMPSPPEAVERDGQRRPGARNSSI